MNKRTLYLDNFDFRCLFTIKFSFICLSSLSLVFFSRIIFCIIFRRYINYILYYLITYVLKIPVWLYLNGAMAYWLRYLLPKLGISCLIPLEASRLFQSFISTSSINGVLRTPGDSFEKKLTVSSRLLGSYEAVDIQLIVSQSLEKGH